MDNLQSYIDECRIISQIPHTLLHLKGKINDIAFLLIVDTGAQASILTDDLLDVLSIRHLLDTSQKGIARGVGTNTITGAIYGCNVQLNNEIHTPVTFRVIESQGVNFALLGLDFLNSFQCEINFSNNTISCTDNHKTTTLLKFLNEKQIENLQVPHNEEKEKLVKAIQNLIDCFPHKNQKIKKITLMIINNILKHPLEPKYKQIYIGSNTIKSIISNDFEKQMFVNFMNNLGFTQLKNKLHFTEHCDKLKIAKKLLSI